MNQRFTSEFATFSHERSVEYHGTQFLVEQFRKGVPFRNYPDHDQRLHMWQLAQDDGNLNIPDGSWWMNPSDNHPLQLDEIQDLQAKGVTRFDNAGRPLHPWIDAIAQYPDFGFACGKGSYYQWGPNFTADPIVLRYDLSEPHVLLIQREDTKDWALPGGFIDPGEDGPTTARRETQEETGITIPHTIAGTHIYQGPVADPRTTLHAWPETTAVRFDIPDELAATLPEGTWQGSDDAVRATWAPLSALEENLFGSHLVLIQQAVRTM